MLHSHPFEEHLVGHVWLKHEFWASWYCSFLIKRHQHYLLTNLERITVDLQESCTNWCCSEASDSKLYKVNTSHKYCLFFCQSSKNFTICFCSNNILHRVLLNVNEFLSSKRLLQALLWPQGLALEINKSCYCGAGSPNNHICHRYLKL